MNRLLTQATGWGFHVAAFKNGRFYDKLTGPKGMLLDDYKQLFEYNDVINFDISPNRTVK